MIENRMERIIPKGHCQNWGQIHTRWRFILKRGILAEICKGNSAITDYIIQIRGGVRIFGICPLSNLNHSNVISSSALT